MTKYAIHHNKERLPQFPPYEFVIQAQIAMIENGLYERDGYSWEPVT